MRNRGLGPKLFPHAVMAMLLLTACGPAENDPGPGGVTAGEAKMLDDAAEMLDARQADYGSAVEQEQAAATDEAAPDKAQ
ncbi:hypothetical protein [Alterisphingorhabdus coralli]|uniref:Secreted protein n=1 Tax=Alterisphingorhabdus coralli TaxID=3071408 RepID=A0AA97I0L0_9SPHN|nr:hypothetical protein [Parasphingorhabdus sp. SCSIO 66989]WOE75784.1 hypothetical protein RB602_03460 [Parasphingorhabdus sp. SCSIO 66989]